MEPSIQSLSERAKAQGLDPYEVCERASIMEIDGGVPRWMAERYALGEWTPADEELLENERKLNHEKRH